MPITLGCLWLLAQTTGAPPDGATAEQGVSLLSKIIAGGVPLICLVIAAISTIALAYQYRANAATAPASK